MLNFTFGIITTENQENRINIIIDSIEKQSIHNYEIIIIGNCNIVRDNTSIISFDETIKPSWITKKKNLITENAKYENVVYLHDYISLEDGWYNNFLSFGDKFDICMNRIINNNGNRFRDWVLWIFNIDRFIPSVHQDRGCLLPYNIDKLTHLMYVSGSYWVAKKEFMLQNKLDERFSWGEGEDVEWSGRVLNKCNYVMNDKSVVRIIKEYKDPAFVEISENNLNKLLSVCI